MKSITNINKIGAIILGIALTIIFASFSESVSKGKIKTDTFKVYGTCGMCKDRIENALDIKGIRFADWDKEHQMLKVTYNSKKITLEQIHQKVADAGHDTDLVKASDEAYGKIADCCKYREGAKCDHEH